MPGPSKGKGIAKSSLGTATKDVVVEMDGLDDDQKRKMQRMQSMGTLKSNKQDKKDLKQQAMEQGAVAAQMNVDQQTMASQIANDTGNKNMGPIEVCRRNGPSQATLEMLFNYGQFTGLTNALVLNFEIYAFEFDMPFPKFLQDFKYYFAWSNIFMIDLKELGAAGGRVMESFEWLAGLGWQFQFMLISVMVPMIFSLLTLMLFKPILKVLWLFVFSLMVCVMMSMIIVSNGEILERLRLMGGDSFNEYTVRWLLYSSVVGVFLCLAYKVLEKYGALWVKYKRQKKEYDKLEHLVYEATNEGGTPRDEVVAGKKNKRAEKYIVKDVSMVFLVRNGLLIVVCLAVGYGMRSGHVDHSVPFDFIGEVVMGVGVLLLLHYIIANTPTGRRQLKRAVDWLNGTYVSSFLLLLSILYMPMTRTIFQAFPSQTAGCLAGTFDPPPSPSKFTMSPSTMQQMTGSMTAETTASLTKDASPCQGCVFLPLVQEGAELGLHQCSVVLQDELCQKYEANYLNADPSIQMKDMTLWWSAAVLMAVSVSLGIPALYAYIVSEHQAAFAELPTAGDDKATQWMFRVKYTKNKAKALYASFEWQTRYFKMVVILQKLMLVLVVLFVPIELVAYAAGGMIAIHFLSFLAALKLMPYIDAKPDFLLIAITFASALNPVVVLLGIYGVELSDTILILVLLSFNFLVPIGALVAGCFHARKENKEFNVKEQALIEEIAEMLVKESQNDGTPMRNYGEERDHVDRILNATTLRSMTTVFSVTVMCAFVSCCLAIVGYATQLAHAPVIMSQPADWETTNIGDLYQNEVHQCVVEEKMTAFEFTPEYSDWVEFTDNCCCMDLESLDELQLSTQNSTLTLSQLYAQKLAVGDEDEEGNSNSFGEIELWKCKSTTSAPNGMYKERIRRRHTHREEDSEVFEIRPFCSKKFNPAVAVPPLFDVAKRSFYVAQFPAQNGYTAAQLSGLEEQEVIRRWYSQW